MVNFNIFSGHVEVYASTRRHCVILALLIGFYTAVGWRLPRASGRHLPTIRWVTYHTYRYPECLMPTKSVPCSTISDHTSNSVNEEFHTN